MARAPARFPAGGARTRDDARRRSMPASPFRRVRARRNPVAARAGRRAPVHCRRGRLVRSAVAGRRGAARSARRRTRSWSASGTSCRASRTTGSCCGRHFFRGIALLEEFGLAYDLLDLSAAPAVRGRVRVSGSSGSASCSITWRSPTSAAARSRGVGAGSAPLPRYPHVYAKLSGPRHRGGLGHWTAEQIRPYLDVAFDCFGADRLMIGSDWPVCTVAADYARTMAVVTDYLSSVAGGRARRRAGRQRAAVLEPETCTEGSR